jgi:multidrug efflux pump subunit AcrA (membrane-fusion protein)
MMMTKAKMGRMALCGLAVALTVGCSSLKTPAAVEVAVSKAAIANAADTGATELAPMEMTSARQKLLRANAAMMTKDYKQAIALANEAQADAKLAQSKANSTKAQAAAETLQDDIRVLREELNRTSPP